MKRRQLFRYASWLTAITILAFAANAGALDHKAIQPRPIQLGVSGGNINDACSAGTLGSLVENKFGRQFILSNNHVLADENRAAKGDLIIQPGSLDDGCRFRATHKVARLRKYVPIKFSASANNLVDAAMAKAIAKKVDTGGSILGIGRVSTTAIDPAIGMRVKKAGRTTGVTTGRISAVHVTVNVGYSSGRVARFVDQFLITNGSFSSPGDSGSLIVKDTSSCPQPVGLLFAGSSTITVANPIKTVYKKLRVQPVGCSASSTEESRMSDGLFQDQALLVQAKDVKTHHEDDLLNIPGVVGVGIGEQDGKVVIKVFVKKQGASTNAQNAVPDKINGFKIVTEVTEEFTAY